MTPIERTAWHLYCEEAGLGAGAVDHWDEVPKLTQDRYIEMAKERRKLLSQSHPAMEELLNALGMSGIHNIERVQFDCMAGKVATVTVTSFMTGEQALGVSKVIKKFELKENQDEIRHQYG